MAKQPVDLSESFQGSAIAKQAFELKRQVKQKDEELQQLQAEIAALKSGALDDAQKVELERQIQALTEQLSQSRGVRQVAISQIQRNPRQPRQMITEAIVQERAASLEEHGQQSPVILFPPNEAGISLLFDGELRWRGASLLNSRDSDTWQTLEAVYLPEESSPEDPQLLERAIVTSLHAEKLCAIDLAENLVALIQQNHSFDAPATEIPDCLNALVNKLKAAGKAHEFSEVRTADKQMQSEWIESITWRTLEQNEILKVLLKFKLNPASVSSNIFPALSYPEDLKQAIRSRGLEDGKVRELAKLNKERLGLSEKKATQVRIQATEQVINQTLSVRDTRSLVNQLISQHNPEPTNSGSNPTIKLSRSLEKFVVDAADKEGLMSLHSSLVSLLSRVEETLGLSK